MPLEFSEIPTGDTDVRRLDLPPIYRGEGEPGGQLGHNQTTPTSGDSIRENARSEWDKLPQMQLDQPWPGSAQKGPSEALPRVQADRPEQ